MLNFTAYQYRDWTVATAAADGYVDGEWKGYYRISRDGEDSLGAAILHMQPTREAAEAAALVVGKREVDLLQ